MGNCAGCHRGTEIRLGYPKSARGLAGKSLSLLEVRGSMAEFVTLGGEQALNLSPKRGKREALNHPPAQLVFPDFPSFTMQLIFMESSQDRDSWIQF